MSKSIVNRFEYSRRSSAMRGMMRRIAKTYHGDQNIALYNPTIWQNTQTGKYTFTITQIGFKLYSSATEFKLVK